MLGYFTLKLKTKLVLKKTSACAGSSTSILQLAMGRARPRTTRRAVQYQTRPITDELLWAAARLHADGATVYAVSRILLVDHGNLQTQLKNSGQLNSTEPTTRMNDVIVPGCRPSPYRHCSGHRGRDRPRDQDDRHRDVHLHVAKCTFYVCSECATICVG